MSESLSAQPAENLSPAVGKLRRIEGALFEAQFDPTQTPAILGELTLNPSAGSQPTMACVVQHLGQGAVRGIALSLPSGIFPGSDIYSSGEPLLLPVPTEILLQAVRTLGRSSIIQPERLETGMKAIDLFCPLVTGGTAGLFGDWGVGLLVIMPEVAHQLADRSKGLTLFAFVPPQPDVAKWKANNQEAASFSGKVASVFLPVADPNDAAFRAQFDFLDTTVYLTRRMAKRGLYPPVDPFLSHSRQLNATPMGQEQAEMAKRARQVLARYRELQPAIEAAGLESFVEEDRRLAARAVRLERFLSQPFFVAEPYTGVPGQYVSCAETLRGCGAILDGFCDDWLEQAFSMVGTLEQVVEKANRLLD